jgi:cytochrome c553
MKKLLSLALSLSLAVSLAYAAPPASKETGIDSKDYKWNAPAVEKNEALKLTGDVNRGKKSYEICTACHLTTGAGRPSGPFPQLAGQHSSVMIKQLVDFRSGIRENPTMVPFAQTRSGPQEIADLAAYIETLCIPVEHGRYEGSDANQRIAAGKAIYESECVVCHKANGEGDKDQLYPVIAGQHYSYLLRQLIEIRDGARRNANPQMVKVLWKLNDNDRIALAAYQASLTMEGKMCPANVAPVPVSPAPAKKIK